MGLPNLLRIFLPRPRPTQTRASIENPQVPVTGITLMAAANQNTNTPFGIITSQVALTSSTVFAAVRVRAETIASLPLNLYRRTSGGKERATDHPLWSLLHDQPNGVMNSYTWRERMIYAKLLQGNSYDYVRRNGAGIPIELIPMDPSKVAVGVKNNRKLFGYDGQILDVDDVMHVMNFTIDGVKGQSTIEYARTSIALDIAQETYGTRFFSQGTSGNYWIEIPGVLDEEQKRRFRESWNANYTGVGNAWTPPLMSNGAKIHALTVPNDDAQFLQSRQFSVAEIARWFRVPGHKVGDLSKASYASLEQQNTEFVSDTVRPDCVLIEQELNRLLRPAERADYFFEFDLNGLLRGDQKSRYDSYAVGRQWGWLSANDVRDLENMNRLPGEEGDVYLVPVNMTTPAKMLAPPPPPPAPPAPPAPADGAVKETPPPAGAGQEGDDTSENEDLTEEGGGEDARSAHARAGTAAVAAASITLADALGRMERKEREAMKRAANKPGAWAELVDEFYDHHAGLLAQAITPSLRSIEAMTGTEGDADRFAAWAAMEICARSRSAMQSIKPEQLAAVAPMDVATMARDLAESFVKGKKNEKEA